MVRTQSLVATLSDVSVKMAWGLNPENGGREVHVNVSKRQNVKMNWSAWLRGSARLIRDRCIP